MPLYRAVDLAANLINSRLYSLKKAVDATMGNGYDTLFLARKTENSGMVYAFDIQEDALLQTRRKLEKEGLGERVKLIKDGHENMDLYVEGPVDAVMFNLGYLPRGDSTIVTRPRSTLVAVKKALVLLKKGGLITIVLYTGHDGGKEEKDILCAYLSGLDPKMYAVLHCMYMNQSSSPPEVILIEKV